MIKTDRYNKAREQLLTCCNKECQRFFKKNRCTLELAYCDLLFDNLKQAKEKFLSICECDARAKWGVLLVNLIENNVFRYPTYFELRNFLEIDINILINHYKGDYVERIVSYADFMASINPETYKFIGRVFLNNNMKQHAMFFFEKAKSHFYHDPELHFILAEIYLHEKNLEEAEKAALNCLQILPNYYPAKHLLEKLHA